MPGPKDPAVPIPQPPRRREIGYIIALALETIILVTMASVGGRGGAVYAAYFLVMGTVAGLLGGIIVRATGFSPLRKIAVGIASAMILNPILGPVSWYSSIAGPVLAPVLVALTQMVIPIIGASIFIFVLHRFRRPTDQTMSPSGPS
jgi:uncharacterized membrane protein YeaQ/YmgE (transglycosylase-associated protein family)